MYLLLFLLDWKDWCWSWNSNTLATWCEELNPWKRPWYWERLKAGGEGDDRGWDGWMASPTQLTRVWANSGRWWRKPGMPQSTGSQRVEHDWVTTTIPNESDATEQLTVDNCKPNWSRMSSGQSIQEWMLSHLPRKEPWKAECWLRTRVLKESSYKYQECDLLHKPGL